MEFRAGAARRTLTFLAVRVGPRETTSPAYARAADWVAARFNGLGYSVRRQRLRVPSGVSWGIPVPAGRTWNVVARPADLAPGQPYLLVGAHLDTVPQAPGAEDDGSGIGVVLELARMAAAAPTRLPVVFVAFAGEEPRGDGDALHHFGSTALVNRLSPAQRREVAGMVALDRVGVGSTVPVCTGGLGPTRVRRALLRLAKAAGIPAFGCTNTLADHWSFEKVGVPAARVGGTPYPEYHSAQDLPRVVRTAQLRRVGQLIWAWLSR